MWRWLKWIVLVIIMIGMTIFFAVCFIFSRVQTSEQNQMDANFRKATIEDKLKEEIKTTYYDISGTSKEELNRQMLTLGPKCGNKRCAAWTEWSIDWSSPISGRIICEPVSVIVSVTYTLPRWVDQNNAPIGLRTDWEEFMIKLKRHEENHKNIAVRWGEQFLAKIKQFNNQDYNDCRELEDKIGQYHATGVIINGCTKETNAYDTETNNGATEGLAL